MDKITKIFSSEIKAVDEKKLIVTHFISTEEPDRIKDIVRADGMVIRGRPAVLVGHDYGSESIAKPLELKVGKNKKGEKGILAKTQYFPDEDGKRLFRKAIDGYMPNWSIGFSSIEEEPIDDGGTDYKKWELLEYSQVSVPMNPGATIELDDEKTGEAHVTFKYFRDEGGVKAEEKPFKGEHACDISSGDYESYRRKNCDEEHEGRCIDVIYGITAEETAEISSLRYNVDAWEEDGAKKHCEGREGEFISAVAGEPEETEERAEETEETEGSWKYCICKSCGYSEDHVAGEPCANKECPDCGEALVGANEKPEEAPPKNMESISGKTGAVLSKKNKNDLSKAMELIGNVLASAESATEEEDKGIVKQSPTETIPVLHLIEAPHKKALKFSLEDLSEAVSSAVKKEIKSGLDKMRGRVN